MKTRRKRRRRNHQQLRTIMIVANACYRKVHFSDELLRAKLIEWLWRFFDQSSIKYFNQGISSSKCKMVCIERMKIHRRDLLHLLLLILNSVKKITKSRNLLESSVQSSKKNDWQWTHLLCNRCNDTQFWFSNHIVSHFHHHKLKKIHWNFLDLPKPAKGNRIGLIFDFWFWFWFWHCTSLTCRVIALWQLNWENVFVWTFK